MDDNNMNFLNSETLLGVVQVAQMQVRAYQEFLKLTGGDKEEAREQTKIYMTSLFTGTSGKKEV